MARETVVRRATDGAERAFDELYRVHVDRVRAVATREIRRGHRSAEVDDVIQEVFARAWRSLPLLRDPDRIGGWLVTVTRRVVIDQARRAACRVRLDRDDDAHLGEAADPIPGPLDLAAFHELADEVGSAIHSLSPRDAVVVSLALHRGLGPHELADEIGTSPGTAKVALHRARRRLRRLLEHRLAPVA